MRQHAPIPRARGARGGAAGAVLAALVLAPGTAAAATAPEAPASPSLWGGVPFLGILLSIALFPLLAPRFWERNYPKVAAGWALLLALPLIVARGSAALGALWHLLVVDYLPFVILLVTLFTIGGGIVVRGTLRGSPAVNAALLATGTLLASVIGTTGASVLLIRPLLRANRGRRHRAHTVVFFIFLVANIGGSLTPLGDPPLFLGFLAGVPFGWTLSLWRETLLVGGAVLAVFVVLDTRLWRREGAAARRAGAAAREPLRIAGLVNLLFLAGVVLAIAGSGAWHPGEVALLGVRQGAQNLARDALLLAMLAASWLATPRRLREENGFTWAPMREVAILFAAIFVTMLPPLEMLRAGAHGPLAALDRAVRAPAHYFWACGLLSSFLDNAPTYLTFLASALGRLYPWLPDREAVLRLATEHHATLAAIATGAVFMGANSYIGNAPNFMVRAIAVEQGVRMPSFFGYMLRYSLPVLLPVFALATWVFFR
ncbi:MAG TPA: sodium:proton antiporter [Thermoanaerobaculaceae bacterium]|nr:sodium:proton antiporter [Thermoanaerobaculaceae bacterium]